MPLKDSKDFNLQRTSEYRWKSTVKKTKNDILLNFNQFPVHWIDRKRLGSEHTDLTPTDVCWLNTSWAPPPTPPPPEEQQSQEHGGSPLHAGSPNSNQTKKIQKWAAYSEEQWGHKRADPPNESFSNKSSWWGARRGRTKLQFQRQSVGM